MTEKDRELHDKALRLKIESVKRHLVGTIPIDTDGKLTTEEMLAIKAGILSAFGYVDALLGGMGRDVQLNAKHESGYYLAIQAMDVGRSLHLDALDSLGL